jgi:cytochrome c oxidase subunit 4
MTTTDAAADTPAAEAEHGLAHVMPVTTLLAVFAALIMLTILTVAATLVPTGAFEIWISLGIATVKAGLVAAYFMHLRYDNPVNALIFVFGLFFVALFLGFTLMDTHQYQPDLIINRPGPP